MSKDAFNELSLDEIQQRLTNIDTDRAALERALDRKQQQVKKDLAQEVRELIESRGHDVGEIVDLMSPKKRPGRGKGDRSYISYVDPNNAENVYVRGVLPRWMKDQMASNGLDASSKEDRDRFKEQFLTRVEG